jgi:uncharacterized surface protein with fasciclin (FAS1) repeats
MTPSFTSRILVALALLSPPAALADCGADHGKKTAAAPAAQGKTIVETAVAAGSFGTLVQAVKAAGLVETLSGPGPFTVFAPTDAAFAALPAGTLERLLADKATLAKVLTYHVVAGEVLSSALPGIPSAPSVQGSPLTFTVTGADARVNRVRITTADVKASNGVIHVIDAVLLPPA